ncbi:hypothetical protein CISIN_1g0376791mg, partial [Citrus sinensis]
MNLNKLSTLYLQHNQLTGHIPVEIRKLTQLQIVRLAENQLEGSVPSSIFELRNLQALDLSNNNLSGTVDLNMLLLNLKSLTALVLSSNKLSLLTRATLNTNLPNFTVIGFNSCNLSEFPYFLHNQDELVSLDLSSNKIAGQDLLVLPWSKMNTLDLGFNKLQGPLPVPSLNGLQALDLSYNNLSGMLPECLGNFSVELSALKLQANNFYRIVPQTFMNGTNLMMIDFSNNSLQGRALILKFNNFHGEIEEPQTGFEFPKLRIIDLSHNRFTGNLPSKHFHCWNAMKDINASKLTYLQVKLLPYDVLGFTYYGYADYSLTMSNKGTEIEYLKLSNLIAAIIISDKNFVGEIPTSISSLKGLRTLSLSNNNLRGGAIPQGTQFSTFTNDWFAGNPGLCGEPLSRKCGNSEASPVEDDPPSESVLAFGWKIVLAG